MLKILQTSTIIRPFGMLLLVALVTIVPCSAVKKNVATLKSLYSFTGNADGAFPAANVVLGSGGAVFGTTSSGANGWGSVYELIPQTGGGWKEVTLYDFRGLNDGAIPTSDLIIGKNNVLYGTTSYGGTFGFGTVFQVTPATGGTWTQRVLYSFKGGIDGANPAAGVVLAASTGVLYGTTYNGGTAGLGTVYQLGPGLGGTWTEKVLYSFQGDHDGAYPLSDLVIGPGTTLYGTTSQGGSVTLSGGCPTPPCTFTNWGVVFQLVPQGGGVWNENVIYTFSGGTDGGSPASALIFGPNSSLYGSTFWGGTPLACPVGGSPQGCGTIYQLTPPTSGGGWTQSVLHTFTGQNPDGAHPYGNLALNVVGILYGTTYAGGLNTDFCFPQSYNGCGTIFLVKPPQTSGGPWIKSNVTIFNGSNGGAPNGIVLGPGGAFYGTTGMGGSSNGGGTVFSLAQ